MKLIKVDTSRIEGVRICARCGHKHLASFMTKYEQLVGYYCTFCSYQVEREWHKYEN